MNWRDSLPDEIKGEAALANFEDVSSLAKSFIETKKMQGDSIRIPGEDAGEDAITEFNSKLLAKVPTLMPKPDFENGGEQAETFYRSIGKPDAPDKYAIPEIKDAPEGFSPNQTSIENFRKIAHENNLTTKQFEGVVNKMIAADIAKFKDGKDSNETNVKAVKELWGMAYNDNMAKVNGVLDKVAAPAALKESVANGTATPETMAWLLGMTAQFGSEGRVPDVNGSLNAAMAPADAQAAIDEINANPDHAYWKGTGEEKARATKRMLQLMEWANPGISTELNRA